jgi:flagellar biosynthesis protein FlhG
LNPSLSIDVTPDTEFSGSLLRRLRESADASLDDVADITKISKRYLHALEENDFDTLPAAVYVRGFVSEYARALGLDSKTVSKSYMSLYRRYRGESG